MFLTRGVCALADAVNDTRRDLVTALARIPLAEAESRDALIRDLPQMGFSRQAFKEKYGWRFNAAATTATADAHSANERVRRRIRLGERVEDLCEEILKLYKASPATEVMRPIEISFAYCIKAEDASGEKGVEREKAWRYLAEARYYLGIARGTTALLAEPSAKQKQQDTAKRGAQARNANIAPAKDESRRLLERYFRTNAFSTKTAALNAILDDMATFTKSENIPLSRNKATLRATMDDWYSKDSLRAISEASKAHTDQ